MNKTFENETIEVPEWAGQGTGILVRRDCLPPSHPWSTYSYIKNELKLDPELYGVRGPGPRCDKCGQNLNQEVDEGNF